MAACGRPLATQHMLGHVQARRICGSRLHSHQCAANARRPAQLRLRSRRCVSAAFFGGRDDAGWQQPSPLNAFLARPQGAPLGNIICCGCAPQCACLVAISGDAVIASERMWIRVLRLSCRSPVASRHGHVRIINASPSVCDLPLHTHWGSKVVLFGAASAIL